MIILVSIIVIIPFQPYVDDTQVSNDGETSKRLARFSKFPTEKKSHLLLSGLPPKLITVL